MKKLFAGYRGLLHSEFNIVFFAMIGFRRLWCLELGFSGLTELLVTWVILNALAQYSYKVGDAIARHCLPEEFPLDRFPILQTFSEVCDFLEEAPLLGYWENPLNNFDHFLSNQKLYVLWRLSLPDWDKEFIIDEPASDLLFNRLLYHRLP